MSLLIIAILIILSPVILMAGFISLVIILGLIYTLINILIGLQKETVKQVRRWLKQEDQKNIQK